MRSSIGAPCSYFYYFGFAFVAGRLLSFPAQVALYFTPLSKMVQIDAAVGNSGNQGMEMLGLSAIRRAALLQLCASPADKPQIARQIILIPSSLLRTTEYFVLFAQTGC